MKVIFTIEQESPDKLSSEIWEFIVIESKILLDSYFLYNKASKRHKPQRAGYYNRIRERDSTISKDVVPLPENIMIEALKEYVSKLTVSK